MSTSRLIYKSTNLNSTPDEIFDMMFESHLEEYEEELTVDSDVDECEEDDYTEEDEI